MTAEFMLLLPALALMVGLATAGFSLGLSRIQLEVEAFQQARHYSITSEADGAAVSKEGRLSCVKVSKPGLIPLQAQSCVIPYGG